MSLVIAASVLAQPQVVNYIQYSATNMRENVYTDKVWADVHKELKDDERLDPYE